MQKWKAIVTKGLQYLNLWGRKRLECTKGKTFVNAVFSNIRTQNKNTISSLPTCTLNWKDNATLYRQ